MKAVSAKTGTQSDLVKEYLDLVYGDSKRELELQTVLPESRRTFAESLAIYKTILSGNPSHVKALKGLACVLQAMKKYEEAIRFFEKILKLCPDDQESKAEMAWCHHCKGDSATGLKCLEELLLLSSTATGQLSDSVASVCHYRVGRIYWETESLRREKDKCFQHFVQSAKFDTENILAFTFLGHYYLLESDRVRAIKCFSKAHSLVVSKNGFSSMIIEFGTISIEHPSKSLCKMYMEEEKLGDACAVLESIVQNCSRDDWAWKTLGVVEMVRKLSDISCWISEFAPNLFSAPFS